MTEEKEEPPFFGYHFVCYDGKKVSQLKDTMKLIFDRTEILYYIIHGHPSFQKEVLEIKNGFVWVNMSHYYISSEQLVKWFRALTGFGEVSDIINDWGFHLGGSNYLESQLEKIKNINDVKKIKCPMDDVHNQYLWKHDIVTSVADQIGTMIQEKEKEGYTLITNLSPHASYPFQLTYRKPRTEDIYIL